MKILEWYIRVAKRCPSESSSNFPNGRFSLKEQLNTLRELKERKQLRLDECKRIAKQIRKRRAKENEDEEES